MVAVADPGIVARWAHVYSDDKAVNTSILFFHLAGILLAGGFAVVTDRLSVLALRKQGFSRSSGWARPPRGRRPWSSSVTCTAGYWAASAWSA